ncbi:Protein NRT1/ PTR family 1.2 [Vitis vinifera]|uniref:Protein NRT1/ PTR family 1.2 n=1 Tax=Vitis vinifera TaxID=29760 RepID=A0A438IHL0_VITVI|nr:Protein NRT1/ PTR family 1.2 [Vitis vinifera]
MEASSEENPEPEHKLSRPRRGVLGPCHSSLVLNESFEKVSNYGLLANIILYMIGDYHMKLTDAAIILTLWSALSSALAVVGAFLSDSYMGRFKVIAIGSFFSFFGWKIGFGVPAILMLVSSVVFLLGASLYIKRVPEKTLFSSFFQVLVAAFRNAKLPFPDLTSGYHRDHDSMFTAPTRNLRWLNKACIIKDPRKDLNPDGSSAKPWKLCTIEQVEMLKSSQFSQIHRKSTRAQRQVPHGNGLMLSVAATTLCGVTETLMRRTANNEGFADRPDAVTSMSAMWLIPQYSFFGLAEAVNTIGQIEFIYSQLPKSMTSVGMALSTLGGTLASVIGVILVRIVDAATNKGGKEGWLADNINRGHLDYYYWLLTAMGVVNLGYYYICCWAFGPMGARPGSANAGVESES